MTDPSFYRPENHPYTEHRTYTGPGCCHCGKPDEAHTGQQKPGKNRETKCIVPVEET